MSLQSSFEKGFPKITNEDIEAESPLSERIISSFENVYKEHDYPFVESRPSYENLQQSLQEALREENYSDIIEACLQCLSNELAQYGEIELDLQELSPQSPATALMVAEAMNLAAKDYDYAFYSLKPAAIVAAWKLGCQFGLGDDSAYYLGDVIGGVASFHDPGEEIRHLVKEILKEPIPQWEYEWSGVRRHDDAHNLLVSRTNGNTFVDEMAEQTLPDDEKKSRAYLKAQEVRTSLADLIAQAQNKKQRD